MNKYDDNEYRSFISKLKTHSDVICEGNESLIQIKYNDINQLMILAQSSFLEGNFLESAKFFRQIAKNVNELYFKIERKGLYNDKNILNDLSGKEWLRHTKSWIVIDGKPSDISPEIKDHPASFPPQLAEYFIEYFTKKGGWVFDPFMGIGSTAVACLNLGRNCWGTEINAKYFTYTTKRISSQMNTLKVKNNLKCQVFNEDCRNLIKISEENAFPPVDFCITSPPYWNILETSRGGVKSTHKQRIEDGLDEKYSDNPKDIGNISRYKDYLIIMKHVFNDVLKLLKINGYLMVIVQNIRPKDGIMIPIGWDLAKMLSKTYILRQEFIWCQDQKQMGIWGYPKTYVSNVHHHYCMVFQKSS